MRTKPLILGKICTRSDNTERKEITILSTDLDFPEEKALIQLHLVGHLPGEVKPELCEHQPYH